MKYLSEEFVYKIKSGIYFDSKNFVLSRVSIHEVVALTGKTFCSFSSYDKFYDWKLFIDRIKELK